MKTLIIYATLGLLAAGLVTLFTLRVANQASQNLTRVQEERIQTWEEVLK